MTPAEFAVFLAFTIWTVIVGVLTWRRSRAIGSAEERSAMPSSTRVLYRARVMRFAGYGCLAVEIGPGRGAEGVAVRDTKARSGPIVWFSPEAPGPTVR